MKAQGTVGSCVVPHLALSGILVYLFRFGSYEITIIKLKKDILYSRGLLNSPRDIGSVLQGLVRRPLGKTAQPKAAMKTRKA